MALYREQGVVLRTWPLGETDRILSILSAGRGKIRAVAKGVRRPGSRFGGRLEPFSHVDVELYEGRSLDIVRSAELVGPYAAIRADYVLSACASTMAEAVDRVVQEDERAVAVYVTLLDGLRALHDSPLTPATVLDAFLFRLASVVGFHPSLHACTGCGARGEHAVLSFAEGGVLCPSCAPADAHPIDPAVRDLLAALLEHGPRGMTACALDAPRRRSAGRIVNGFLTHHIGAPLRAWELVPR